MAMEMTDEEDQQLNNNLKYLDSELSSLIEDNESELTAGSVLGDLSSKMHELSLDLDTDVFFYHGLQCQHSLALPEQVLYSTSSELNKQPTTNKSENDTSSTRSSKQLQKWSRSKQNEKKPNALKAVTQRGKQSFVLSMVQLFKSLHANIAADLPSHQLNSMPSDYVFELPKKRLRNKGSNMRHHLQVLCTKLDRFIIRLRRNLELNRHFDFLKYTECDELINSLSRGQLSLRTYTCTDLRQRNFQFINQSAYDNAIKLQALLQTLRDHIKLAQLHVYVFNWEVDIDHRYSLTMKATLDETNKRAMALVVSELQVPQSKELTFEEEFIGKHFQLANVVNCVKEHEDFLTALLETPENYFPPEVIQLCQPPKDSCQLLSLASEAILESDSLEHLALGGDILEVGPSSPTRVSHRNHVPNCNRA